MEECGTRISTWEGCRVRSHQGTCLLKVRVKQRECRNLNIYVRFFPLEPDGIPDFVADTDAEVEGPTDCDKEFVRPYVKCIGFVLLGPAADAEERCTLG